MRGKHRACTSPQGGQHGPKPAELGPGAKQVSSEGNKGFGRVVWLLPQEAEGPPGDEPSADQN